MTATEARKLTDQALNGSNGVVGQMVIAALDKITKAAKDGESSISNPVTGGNFKQEQAAYERLKALGYKVKSESDQRECKNWTSVSW
jgi:hypothetical protein